ncbi:MAG: FAD-dependent oxidoreductase [Burkholderiaceae bacterium]
MMAGETNDGTTPGRPAAKRLVLVGGGHAHAQVLENWIEAPIDGVELWLVSPDPRSPYSGMVPGWLAGLYNYDAICIDLVALCMDAGAVFVQDEMIDLDATVRRVHLRSGGSIDYDVLSLDVGSTLVPPDIDGSTVLPLRPLSQLRSRWDALLGDLADSRPDAAIAITCVGGGAAGFESILALQRRLQAQRADVRATLWTSSDTILPGLARGAVRRATRVLADRGIAVHVNRAFDAVLALRCETESASRSGDAARPPATRHVVLWATGARSHAWQAHTALATDAAGFFRVDRMLRSTSHADVFASGDCAAWERPLPKAGVYAVRMGPVLVRNLRAALGDGRPRVWRPQHRHLVLLSTADRRAIASRGVFSLSGAWVWRWKDLLDRRFLGRFAPRRFVSPADHAADSPEEAS